MEHVASVMHENVAVFAYCQFFQFLTEQDRFHLMNVKASTSLMCGEFRGANKKREKSTWISTILIFVNWTYNQFQ